MQLMRWGTVVIPALALAIACGDGKKKAPAEEPATGGTSPEPAAKSAEKSPAAESERAPAPLASIAAPRATAKREAFDAWLATQSNNPKQVPADELPSALSAALLALGKGALSMPREVELRWARALGRAAVAFSFHHPPPDNDLDEYWFAVAVAYPKRSLYGVHSVATQDVIDSGDSEFGPGESRDVDGDDVPDLIVNYETEHGGGGDFSSAGIILLGSRGGALRVELESRDADWEVEDGCHDENTKAALACWTTMEGRALLVAVIEAVDGCTKSLEWRERVAVRARTDGTLGVDGAYAAIEARGTLAALERWRGGKAAKPAAAEKPDGKALEPGPCPAGPLMVPRNAAYALLRGFTPEPPAEPSLRFEPPRRDTRVAGEPENKNQATADKAASPPSSPATDAKKDGRKELSEAQLDAFKKELRNGRSLGKKKQYAEAAAAFERALAIKPGDARASSELGWTALQLGEIERSIAASQASVEAASDRRLKAASLYNLGLALEKKQNRTGAIAAFRESFDQRPNQSVYKKLAALDATTAADLVAPRPMPGPYPSLEAYCHEWLRKHPAVANERLGDGWACGPDNRTYTEKYEWLAAAPFEDLVLFSHETDWVWTYRVAMKTKAGWFISPAMWTREANTDYGTLDHILVQPDGVLSLAWTFEVNERDRSAEVSPYMEWKYLVICGADESGRVSCTPTLEVGYDQGGDGKEKISWKVDAKLTQNRLVLTSADKDLPKHIAPLIGAHEIAFH